ncbi:defective in Cullin neddylation protein 1 [Hysterangium stoloniferum]|nr:defective in Cullin neddylation protein 1 [Hysterangium stoloniferum]
MDQSKSSRSSKSKINTAEFTAALNQFMAITNLNQKDATKYIQKFGRADLAIDAFYNDPIAISGVPLSKPLVQIPKLNALFDRYKEAQSMGEDDVMGIDGTLRLCADLEVDPEDVVLLAVACELNAPAVGSFTRTGWREGWKALGVDSIPSMRNLLPRLRRNLGTDYFYFKRVYLFTFDFAKVEGQRSVALETAQAFWGLLLPHAVAGGALVHVPDDDEQERPDGTQGWNDSLTMLWFEFLAEKGGKGISRDTWNMFISFARTVDFDKHDFEGAWPSMIDDFVAWANERASAS